MKNFAVKRGFVLPALVLGVISAAFLANLPGRSSDAGIGYDGIAEATRAQYEAGASQTPPVCVVPTLIPQDWWITSHDKLARVARGTHADTVFFGDSITAFMNEKLLHSTFGDGAVNMGIPGDQTQHLLWRLQNGEMDFPAPGPRAIVLLIGTNNLSTWALVGSTDLSTGKTHYKRVGVMACTNQEIFQGVQACVNEMRTRAPQARILVIGILPRDENGTTVTRQRITEINAALAGLADNKHVYFADIGGALLEPDGKIARSVMYDFLHPTKDVGYERMFTAIKPRLNAMVAHTNSPN